MGLPNCTLWLMYESDSSRAPSAIPRAMAPTPTLAPSRDPMAIPKPLPSSPSLLAAGTRQSSKNSSAVSEHLIPILSSIFPVEKPFIPFSTMNADIPFAPFEGSVSANTRIASALAPPVMKHLFPLRIYSSVAAS